MAITGIFLSTFTKKFWQFIVLYGFCSGVGTGICYLVPLVCSYRYFPNKKGFLTGLIMGFFGLSSTVFNILATKLVNPENKKATIPAPNGDVNLKFFDSEVANRVPMMFQSLCVIWLCLIFVSAALISIPKSDTKVVEKD